MTKIKSTYAASTILDSFCIRYWLFKCYKWFTTF